MTLSSLTPDELAITERALRLMGTGNVLSRMEFYSRIGVPFAEFQQLLADWPSLDDSDDDSAASVAINNTFNEFLHGVGMSDEAMLAQLGTIRKELRMIFKKWKASEPPS